MVLVNQFIAAYSIELPGTHIGGLNACLNGASLVGSCVATVAMERNNNDLIFKRTFCCEKCSTNGELL